MFIMGKKEVYDILKEKKIWMSNRDIQEFLPQSTNSINRVARKLNYDFPDRIKIKEVIKRGCNHIFYFKYVGK